MQHLYCMWSLNLAHPTGGSTIWHVMLCCQVHEQCIRTGQLPLIHAPDGSTSWCPYCWQPTCVLQTTDCKKNHYDISIQYICHSLPPSIRVVTDLWQTCRHYTMVMGIVCHDRAQFGGTLSTVSVSLMTHLQGSLQIGHKKWDTSLLSHYKKWGSLIRMNGPI